MTLKQFLIARTVEDLTRRSCVFELEDDDEPRCLCPAPSGAIDELFAQVRLINRWSALPSGGSLLKLLAGKYAAHEEYELQWRPADRDDLAS